MFRKGRLPLNLSSHLWNGLAVQAKYNPAHGLVAMCDIEKHLMGDLWAFRRFNRLSHEKEGSCQDQAQGDHKLLEVRHCEEVLHLLQSKRKEVLELQKRRREVFQVQPRPLCQDQPRLQVSIGRWRA